MHHRISGNPRWRHVASVPFIWLVLPAFILLDICLEIYHQVAFRLYRLPLVSRSQYIKFDRHKLKYLTLYDKINCTYCGYANGLLPYATKIAGETEKYWCSIKHQESKPYVPPPHHKDFLPYGNKKLLTQKFPITEGNLPMAARAKSRPKSSSRPSRAQKG